MKDIDVLCIGVTSYDLVFKVDHHPTADEKTVASELISCGGGPAANAAVTVSKLGLKSAFCGYLGQDIYGDLHYQELQAAKINTELLIRGDEPTPLSTILVKPNGDRSLVNYRSRHSVKAPSFNFTETGAKVVIFDGHEPEISHSVLKEARKKNIPTILDAGSVNKGTALLFDKVDYLICSETFAREHTGKKVKQALKELSRHNKNVIITMGEKGLLWHTQKGKGSFPAFLVKTVDTTAAGDVFHGAFARCLVRGKSWQETLHFCSAAAALTCTRPGGRTSIPALEEVHTFLQKKGL